MLDFLGATFNLVFVQPLVNLLVVMYALLGHNFVLATLGATVLVQLVTWPLTMKSLESSKKMQALQTSDEWKAVQKKYGKDREKMAQETMRMYKEAGVNPAAGCLPTLVQMPLLIAFYYAINLLLAVNPESLLDLTRHLYRAIPFIAEIAKQTIPLQSQFLWLNLARPDPFYVMPVLVAASTWFSQQTMSVPSADPQQASMNKQMQIMMPIMFGFFTLSFPSGLAIYWVISSLVRMVIQGFTQGWNFVLPKEISFLTTRSVKAAQPKVEREMSTQRELLMSDSKNPNGDKNIDDSRSASPSRSSKRRQRRRSRRH